MRFKWLDGVLIGLTILGSVFFVRVQSQLAELHKAQARIVAAVGEMKIQDPSVAQIKALETNQPWQWAWRVYLPDNSNGTLTYQVGQGSSGSLGFASSQQEFIARLSLTQLKDGRLGLYNRFEGGCSFSSFGTKEFGDFLREHRDELEIEQLGSQGAEQLKAGGPTVVFFRLKLSDELARQASERFPDRMLQKLIPTVLEVELDIP